MMLKTTAVMLCDYSKDAPIRIDTAVKIAFPDGSMSVKGLRKERDANRLTTEIIANKEYTTLAAIERMRELCRVQAKERALSGVMNTGKRTGRLCTPPDGISSTESVELAQAAAEASLERLKSASMRTLSKSTPRRATGTVIPIR
ncbi:excisionase [Mesorhizobium sp. ES1-4]|uniref:excisionase n=1 Tax=Mesorhizobium sp. ES1-4 TaxID=2876627 RepID=UPI001CC98A8D|nr:excisionase [Mesorhizobium sp. ES1-4]MBZ9795728.1 excisionase [Mesorhizobium sp. ES1-4]